MKYTHLLPFLDREEIKDLAMKIISGEVKNVKIVTLYPFLDRETMDEIVNKLIEAEDAKGLKYSLPFISKESISKIYDAVKKGELEGLKESYLMPFMGQSKIKEMFADLIKKASDGTEDLEDEVEDLEDDFENFEDLDDELEDLQEEKAELLKEKEALKKELEKLKKNMKK